MVFVTESEFYCLYFLLCFLGDIFLFFRSSSQREYQVLDFEFKSVPHFTYLITSTYLKLASREKLGNKR